MKKETRIRRERRNPKKMERDPYKKQQRTNLLIPKVLERTIKKEARVTRETRRMVRMRREVIKKMQRVMVNR